jgi:hypothetical protein
MLIFRIPLGNHTLGTAAVDVAISSLLLWWQLGSWYNEEGNGEPCTVIYGSNDKVY